MCALSNRLIYWFVLALSCAVICLALPERLPTVMSNSRGERFASSKPVAASQSATSSQVSIHAAGRGYPWIKLDDGLALDLQFANSTAAHSLTNQSGAKPCALTTADFDEDGTPDLVSGYRLAEAGAFALLRGNPDSIYPFSPEAQQRKAAGAFTSAAFFSPATGFDLPQAADFVGAGDFDADGHWDVVTAARGQQALYFSPGDGKGHFGAAQRIELPGAVTALATGEVNRADGLTDLIIGVLTNHGPQALVFESPNGALRGTPESFNLSAEATAIAVGNLDDEYTMDIAIAAGDELVVVYGRDRKLSLDETQQAAVTSARTSRRSFASGLRGVAMGEFNGNQKIGLAVLTGEGGVHLLTANEKKAKKKKKPAGIESWKDEELAKANWPTATGLVRVRVASLPSDDVVVVDPAGHSLGIVVSQAAQKLKSATLQPLSLNTEGEPVAVLPMRLNADALSDLVVLTSDQMAPTVMKTASGGLANGAGEVGATDFAPQATFTVTNTNDAGAGSLRQAILDANGAAGLDTITFAIGTGPQTITLLSGLPTVTSPVVIDGTTQPGFSGNPIIEINATNSGANVDGLNITAGNTVVRGLVINRAGGHGISMITNGSNLIEGNFIGTNAAGTADFGNFGVGVIDFDTSGNTFGGTTASARNVISGNGGSGVYFGNTTAAAGNFVQGNFIGTDVTGQIDLGNGVVGVFMASGANNTVGGATPGARNVIAGNDNAGVNINNAGATGNLVQGNFIGTNAAGTAILANSSVGVALINAPNTTVGGTAPTAGNIISGNFQGVAISNAGATGNLVQGNLIGTNAAGTSALANQFGGIGIDNAPGNTIGGIVAGARNVVSGNGNVGIVIGNPGATGNQVQGNFIGTDVTGTLALGNQAGGADIFDASNNVIGGATPAARNIISANGGTAGSTIVGLNFNTIGNQIVGNFIGTDVTGTIARGNTLAGVLITNNPNTVPPKNSLVANNLIAFNGGAGVGINRQGTGHTIRSNSIFSNGGLGIDLSGVAFTDGPTANDPCDTDTGPNNLQNAPVLNLAFPNSGRLNIRGSLNSAPNTTYTIEFFANATCDASGFGEGQTFIGSTQVITDASCNVSFTFIANPDSEGPPILDSQSITATATDPQGNTSEFSNCAPLVVNPADLALTKAASSLTPKPGDPLTYTLTVTNNGPTTANNVVLTDNLPAQLAFVSCSATSGGTCGGSGNARTVTFSQLAANSSATVTFATTVGSGITNGTVVTNTASVTTASTDTVAANNTASVSVTVTTNPIALNCTANITQVAPPGQSAAVVTYLLPTPVGNPQGFTVACTPPSGSTFPLGVTQVNCQASDAANNRGACSFTVSIFPFVANNPAPDKPSVDFGNAISLPNPNPPSGTFALLNASALPVNLTLTSIERTGSDVNSGKIGNADDRAFFTVFALNPSGGETPIAPGSEVTIPAGQRNFRVQFNPTIPAVATRTTNLSASQVLPDIVVSAVNFTTSDNRTLTVNLVGRVGTNVKLIDPVNTSRAPVVTFTKSGDQFTLTYSVYDANLDASRASYQFLDSGGQATGAPLELNLAGALQPLGLARGQSFTVEQPFTGASGHDEIAGVRVTVFDGETSVTATANLGAGAASAVHATSATPDAGMKVRLTALRVHKRKR